MTVTPSPAVLVSPIVSGDPPAAARAQATLRPACDAAELAADSLAQAVTDDLLGRLFDDGPGWRRIREPDRPPRPRAASEKGVAFGDSVPSVVSPSWAARIPGLSRVEWSVRREAEDGTWILGVGPVRKLGPIVEVRYSMDQPGVYTARTTYLVLVDAEWRVLSESTFLAHE